MVQPNWYYNLKSGKRESALGYLLQCLLESRMRLGYPSAAVAEEAINVYLGHLLVEVMTAEYQARSLRYVATRGSDVFQKVEDISEAYEKFQVYRTNADYRLLTASIFRPHNPKEPEHVATAAACQDEGRTYYHFAAEYNKQFNRKLTPLSEILETLSETFEKYEEILTHMRHAYFHLWSACSQEVFQREMRVLEHTNAVPEREQLIDAFLDAYRTWKTSGQLRDHAHMTALAQQLSAFDPEFRFEEFGL